MIRITQHPKDHTFLLLKVPQDLNVRMGSYGPAQLAPDLHGYVMAADQIGSFQAWARYQGIQVLNEVRDKAEPTKPIECGNRDAVTGEPCCAPYPVGRLPKFCGACGQPAKPVIYEDDEPMIGARCATCGRLNHGGPAYCVACGERLPDRHLRASAIPRVKADPVPLSQAIGELDTTRAVAGLREVKATEAER